MSNITHNVFLSTLPKDQRFNWAFNASLAAQMVANTEKPNNGVDSLSFSSQIRAGIYRHKDNSWFALFHKENFYSLANSNSIQIQSIPASYIGETEGLGFYYKGFGVFKAGGNLLS